MAKYNLENEYNSWESENHDYATIDRMYNQIDLSEYYDTWMNDLAYTEYMQKIISEGGH